jgi:HAE1 family hydrophobic/amphiphilic exporter-1
MGVPAMIGMLMLIGIVVTNAIVLIDLINQYRAQGMGVVEAIVEGGRHRLRPILMTALATIFALLPMALGVTGEGGFISQPLAVVVIGGLVTSTLLTLLLVPTLYAMVELFKERRAKKKAAKRAKKAGIPAPAASEETSTSEEPEPAKA